MPICLEESSKKKETKETISLMRIFQENVKTDISHTNDIIDLIQKKMEDFDLNLNTLKTSTRELNSDFASIEEKLTTLDSSFKRVSSMSSLCRSDSMSSVSSVNSSAESEQFSPSSSAGSENESDSDQLESTFVFVNKDESTNDLTMDEYQRQKRALSQSSSSDKKQLVLATESELNRRRQEEYQLIDENCDQLIQLLMKNSL